MLGIDSIGKLAERVGEMGGKIDGGFAGVTTKIDEGFKTLSKKVDEGFKQLGHKMDTLSAKLVETMVSEGEKTRAVLKDVLKKK